VSARVVSVNVGRSKPLFTGSRIVDSAIVKPAVTGIQALIIERERLGELEPARPDMLPKLAAWYEERQAA
jgi:hypothetical protein